MSAIPVLWKQKQGIRGTKPTWATQSHESVSTSPHPPKKNERKEKRKKGQDEEGSEGRRKVPPSSPSTCKQAQAMSLFQEARSL